MAGSARERRTIMARAGPLAGGLAHMPKVTRLAALGVLLLLLPTMAPVCEETEPNNTLGQANQLRLYEYGQGDISPLADADFWVLENVAPGNLVFAYVDTHASSTSRDSTLQVFAHDGALIQTDYDDGPDLSSAIAGAVAPQAGNVFYRIRGATDALQVTPYNLYQAILSPAAIGYESEDNDSHVAANVITRPIMSGDTVNGDFDLDYFKFTAPAGATIVAIVDDDPDRDGILTDTTLFIVDTDGGSLAHGDDSGLGNANAAGAATVGTAGTYSIAILHGGEPPALDSDYNFVVLVNGVAYSDADSDGVPDTDDNCPLLSNAGQVDIDSDGFGDVCDGCPASIIKQAPGVCGCSQPDVDINGDGTIDCSLADPARSLLSGVGLLLVPDAANHRIMAFNPRSGNLVDPAFVPADPVNLPAPFAAILGPDHNSILVSDSTANVVQRYDLDGHFLGTFAPAGGAAPATMTNPAGLALRPNGHLIVCVRGGANGEAVAEFDAAGHFVGNFIANGGGGLEDPVDVHIRTDGRVLVSGRASGVVHQYDSVGAHLGYLDPTTAGIDAPVQIIETADSHLLIADGLSSVSHAERGVLEYLPGGTRVARLSPPSVAGFQGIYELGNGNLLITTTGRVGIGAMMSGGVYEMDRAGRIVGTKLSGVADLGLIEYAVQDADSDGVSDSFDGCPNDANKIAPGQCGCGVADTDGDGDGALDCLDGCPADHNKTLPGRCGCGAAETDTDGDGVPDCADNCPNSPNADQADANGDGLGDACAPPPAGSSSACGCSPGLPFAVPLTLLGFGWMKRRR
jgi:uncharacterized protein (TIGR03382 family)